VSLAQARRPQERGISLTSPGIVKRVRDPRSAFVRGGGGGGAAFARVGGQAGGRGRGASGVRGMPGARGTSQLQPAGLCLPGGMPRPSLAARAGASGGLRSGGSAALQVEGLDRALGRVTIAGHAGVSEALPQVGGATTLPARMLGGV
jgi:hypothetical protein